MKFSDYLKIPYRWVFRTNKSYSQTGEDIITRFFLSDIKRGFFVDIGANDPIHLNNTYLFYKQGWQGLCIEPNEFRCKIFRAVRPRDRVICCGAGSQNAEMDFFIFDLDNISTFSSFEAEEFQKLGHKIVETKKIPVYTLANIMDKYANGRAIDLLSVDTEGLDLEILHSNDWVKYRPKVVIVETAEYRKDSATRTHSAFNNFFTSLGYVKIADTYINGIYMEGSLAKSKKIESII
jgi:FkbM family methyltransferase